MAETTSPTTGRRYGVAQVCRVWRMPRSSFYAAGEPETDVTPAVVSPARRGPKPAVSDDALLTAIRADTWSARLGPAKAIGRSGPGCAPSTACECRASVCCG